MTLSTQHLQCELWKEWDLPHAPSMASTHSRARSPCPHATGKAKSSSRDPDAASFPVSEKVLVKNQPGEDSRAPWPQERGAEEESLGKEMEQKGKWHLNPFRKRQSAIHRVTQAKPKPPTLPTLYDPWQRKSRAAERDQQKSDWDLMACKAHP